MSYETNSAADFYEQLMLINKAYSLAMARLRLVYLLKKGWKIEAIWPRISARHGKDTTDILMREHGKERT
jgi:hypothetical protein